MLRVGSALEDGWALLALENSWVPSVLEDVLALRAPSALRVGLALKEREGEDDIAVSSPPPPPLLPSTMKTTTITQKSLCKLGWTRCNKDNVSGTAMCARTSPKIFPISVRAPPPFDVRIGVVNDLNWHINVGGLLGDVVFFLL